MYKREGLTYNNNKYKNNCHYAYDTQLDFPVKNAQVYLILPNLTDKDNFTR